MLGAVGDLDGLAGGDRLERPLGAVAARRVDRDPQARARPGRRGRTGTARRAPGFHSPADERFGVGLEVGVHRSQLGARRLVERPMARPQPTALHVDLLPVGTDLADRHLEVGVVGVAADPQVGRPGADDDRVVGSGALTNDAAVPSGGWRQSHCTS